MASYEIAKSATAVSTVEAGKLMQKLSQTEQAIFDMWQSGLGYSEIASELNIAYKTVSVFLCRIRRRLGKNSLRPVKEKNKLTPHQENIRDLWVSGKSLIQIGVAVNNTPKAVSAILTKYIYPKYKVKNRKQLIATISEATRDATQPQSWPVSCLPSQPNA